MIGGIDTASGVGVFKPSAAHIGIFLDNDEGNVQFDQIGTQGDTAGARANNNHRAGIYCLRCYRRP